MYLLPSYLSNLKVPYPKYAAKVMAIQKYVRSHNLDSQV